MERVIILGAAGRDFHNFNTVFRVSAAHRVVCFTATQIPGIDGRVYPAVLAGPLYPDGIPVEPEERLEDLIREHDVGQVVFAYSDARQAAVPQDTGDTPGGLALPAAGPGRGHGDHGLRRV